MTKTRVQIETKLREVPDISSSTDAYAHRFAGPVGEFFLHTQTRLVLDLIGSSAGLRVLDVGGGHGQLARPLVSAGCEVTILGSDVSCRHRLDKLLEPSEFTFVEGDLLGLPFDANSFDIVLAFRLLPHVVRWQAFLAELCRVSRTHVIVDYPEIRSFNLFADLLFGLKKRLEGDTRKYRCFRQSQVAEEFRKHGFSRCLARKQFFLPMALHRKLGVAWLSKTVEDIARWTGLTYVAGSPVILRTTYHDSCPPIAKHFR